MPGEKTKLVYSTDKAIQPVEKALQTGVRPASRKVIVRLDRKGRGGKSVTLIEGLQMQQKERETLLKLLKARLGTGGTVKDTYLEIQGDHRDTLMTMLDKMGYAPKRSGG